MLLSFLLVRAKFAAVFLCCGSLCIFAANFLILNILVAVVVGLFSNAWSEYEDELASKREALQEEAAAAFQQGGAGGVSSLASRAGSLLGAVLASGRSAAAFGSARSNISMHSVHSDQGAEQGGVGAAQTPPSPAAVPPLAMGQLGGPPPAAAATPQGGASSWQALSPSMGAHPSRRASAASASRRRRSSAVGPSARRQSALEQQLDLIAAAQLLEAQAAEEGQSSDEEVLATKGVKGGKGNSAPPPCRGDHCSRDCACRHWTPH